MQKIPTVIKALYLRFKYKIVKVDIDTITIKLIPQKSLGFFCLKYSNGLLKININSIQLKNTTANNKTNFISINLSVVN